MHTRLIEIAVSIHAFRGEGDAAAPSTRAELRGFNPRLPGGRRRCRSLTAAATARFNPRLPGGRRLPEREERATLRCVSIHAFRGEGDRLGDAPLQRQRLFQSTPSGGKATKLLRRCAASMLFQSTPSGGKATLRRPVDVVRSTGVSIHAFRGEGDAPSIIWST